MDITLFFRSVYYNPELVRISGSVVSGILLTHLILWENESNYWVAKTHQEINADLGLSIDEINEAYHQLECSGLIKLVVDSANEFPANSFICRVHFGQVISMISMLHSKSDAN